MAKFFDPNTVLIDLKDGTGWTLADAQAGCLVTGGTGSGKTSGPGRLLRSAFLTPSKGIPGGMGGLVLAAKPGECEEWTAACREAGRGQDVIRVTPGGQHRFNILDWIASWGDDGERGPIPTVALLEEIAHAVNPVGEAAGDDNAFFESALHSKLIQTVLLCQLAQLPVSLPLMRELSSSTPESVAEAHDPNWQRKSILWHALREADALTKSDPAARADFRECRRYHLRDFPSLSSRTKGVIDIMYSSLVQPFLMRPLRPLFCEFTSITPEACLDGKIILVDLPVQEYGVVGRLAALAWKRAFQLSVLRRSGPPGTLRPAFLWADEAQNFLTPLDAEYQAVARSAGGVTCYLTQSISSIRLALGNDDKAEALTSNLQTKIWCQNSGETAKWASGLVGERYIQVSSVNVGRGGHENQEQGASSHAGLSRSEQKRAYLEPSVFQRLRRGGAANGLLVDAVVFCGGKLFAGDTEPLPYKILAFKQR